VLNCTCRSITLLACHTSFMLFYIYPAFRFRILKSFKNGPTSNRGQGRKKGEDTPLTPAFTYTHTFTDSSLDSLYLTVFSLFSSPYIWSSMLDRIVYIHTEPNSHQPTEMGPVTDLNESYTHTKTRQTLYKAASQGPLAHSQRTPLDIKSECREDTWKTGWGRDKRCFIF